MKTKLSRAGIIAVRLLEAVGAASDVFPPLKSAAGGALHIAKLIEDFKSNKKDWARFAEHIQKNIALVVQSLSHHAIGDNTEQLKDRLEALEKSLLDVQRQIEDVQSANRARRVIEFIKDPKRIADMEKDLDRAVSLFSLDSEIQLGQDVSQTVRDLTVVLVELRGIREAIARVEDSAAQVHADVKIGIHIANLARLPYANNATWNPGKSCLSGTRQSILEEIKNWASAANTTGKAQIFWLTSVPGAGKTTIAHSVAKLFAQEGCLGSTFFFNREDAERAPKIFGTMACDLASKFPHYRSFLSQAIEQDISLASAGLIRHFQGLILPFNNFSLDMHLVFVIDALDEGYSKELINILTVDFANLPGTFKIIVTSRDVDELKPMHHAAHVHHTRFNHLEESNLKDVELVSKGLLKEIGRERNLEDWPTDEANQQLVEKSEGLMIWVVAVCQYLMEVPYPKEDLDDILKEGLGGDQGAEAQMDDLYARILLKYTWKNRRFSERYHQVMGAILACRVPLSSSAIQALRPNQLDIQNIIPYFKPLLQVMPSGASNQPLQIIHKSLHEFLTERAHIVPEWMGFSIDEKEHSQQLALQCLNILNAQLSEGVPCTGYLKGASRAIPNVADGLVSEELWYACRFWIDHIGVFNYAQEDIIVSIHQFLLEKAVLWLEVSTAKGSLPNILPLLDWIKKFHQESLRDILLPDIAIAFMNISTHLLFEGRKQEALTSAQHAVSLTLKQDKESLQDFNKRHAASLDNLSIMLSQMGSIADALPIVKEAVGIYRKLAEEDSQAYNNDLAKSLHNLSRRLSQVGERQEALATIKEAVEIRRKLAQQDPMKFNASLALSLHNLSICLSDVGLRDEALNPIREAVGMREDLASKNFTEHGPDLAASLNTLSYALLDMNIRDEAIDTIMEAVKIRRELAKKNPSAYNLFLAESLCNLSTVLSSAGSKEESLAFIQEATVLYRQLAEDNPMAHNLMLAQALNNLSIIFFGLGQIPNALSSIRDAIQVYRGLASQQPSLYVGELAQALSNMSAILLDSNEPKDEALSAIKEAVKCFRQLAEDESLSHMHQLAGSLTNMSRCLFGMGLKEEAISPMSEAVSLHRQLAESKPAAYKHDFANSLSTLASKLMEIGRNDQALLSLRKAVEIQRELVQQSPITYEADLAETLGTLSTLLTLTDQQSSALESLREITEIYKILASRNAAYRFRLSESLINLSLRLSDLELKEESLTFLREAVNICRAAAGDVNSLTNRGYLAMALKYLSEGMMEVNLREEALAHLKEAVEIYREVSRHQPAVYIAALLDCLQLLSSILVDANCPDEAISIRKEAEAMLDSQNDFVGNSGKMSI